MKKRIILCAAAMMIGLAFGAYGATNKKLSHNDALWAECSNIHTPLSFYKENQFKNHLCYQKLTEIEHDFVGICYSLQATTTYYEPIKALKERQKCLQKAKRHCPKDGQIALLMGLIDDLIHHIELTGANYVL